MFTVFVKLVPNSVATTLCCVLHSLEHSDPTMFYLGQVLSALCPKFQSNQLAIFLATEFDGSTCE